ncbi:alpha/beta fold hydrolase [Nonomuraea africana]|uniref:Pimeloyl-ACP methyl ester carboxylesterase n=1 Tax=Nonomuraea africana TaxID=46171 RepID=A0ABR9KDK7_9ACTN|nr:alpha/beta hydrolase [Nonomuraea africana]MBE1560094.1 pimeloyl-ACP methyl ester carboxylesterase [Nonomuraea africana]
MSPQDITITDHVIPLAARDHSGDGPAVLLLHGLGGTLEAWDALAPLLAREHRVVVMDLRGHGLSGDGPWEWDAVLGDLEAVVKHFHLDRPAIVGHSLGGMLALMWALRHPDCPAIVNLDGLRSVENDPGNYPGMATEALKAALDQLRATFDAQAAMMDRPIPAEQAALFPQRSLTTRDGHSYLRPSSETLAALRYAPEFRDAIPLLRVVTCPALVVLADRDPAGMDGGELMAAFRRGVRRDLLDLPGTVEVTELAASHNMVAEQPSELADLIIRFLTGSAEG